jgi:hypothetical protein
MSTMWPGAAEVPLAKDQRVIQELAVRHLSCAQRV